MIYADIWYYCRLAGSNGILLVEAAVVVRNSFYELVLCRGMGAFLGFRTLLVVRIAPILSSFFLLYTSFLLSPLSSN